jgi:hypothetical protein
MRQTIRADVLSFAAYAPASSPVLCGLSSSTGGRGRKGGRHVYANEARRREFARNASKWFLHRVLFFRTVIAARAVLQPFRCSRG